MKRNIEKIRNYLTEHFEVSAYAGDIASNSKVFYNRKTLEYKVETGQSINNLSGDFDWVMERLKQIKDWM